MKFIGVVLLSLSLLVYVPSIVASKTPVENEQLSPLEVDDQLPFSEIGQSVKVEYFSLNNCIFIKVSLYDGRIVIFDVWKKDTSDYEKMKSIFCQDSFSLRVLLSLQKISKNPIGRRLLEELHNKLNVDDPLVIISYDIFDKVVSYDGLKGETNVEIKLNSHIPVCVLKNIVIYNKEANDSVAVSGWYSTFSQRANESPAFFAKDFQTDNLQDPGFSKNIIILNFSRDLSRGTGFSQIFDLSRKNNSLAMKDCQIKLSSDLGLEDDVVLFHELNHAKHWKDRLTYNTYEEVGCAKSNNNSNNSSLGIKIMSSATHKSTDVNLGVMSNAEEELQLTGYTHVNNMSEGIWDEVNETAYRFAAKKRIRFPYNMTILDNEGYYITLEDLAKLLYNAGILKNTIFVVDFEK